MSSNTRFRCPVCSFAVFNRRVATCESCAAALPIEFRYSADELTFIDAEHERNEKHRQLAREDAEREAQADRLRSFPRTFNGG